MPSPKDFQFVPAARLQQDIDQHNACIDTIMSDGTGTASYSLNGMNISRTSVQTVIDNRNAMYTALALKTPGSGAFQQANPIVHTRRY